MSFFKRKHKTFAKLSTKFLQQGYLASELSLRTAAASGDEKAMHKAMKRHQIFEYALLYKNSPEYKKKTRKF